MSNVLYLLYLSISMGKGHRATLMTKLIALIDCSCCCAEYLLHIACSLKYRSQLINI